MYITCTCLHYRFFSARYSLALQHKDEQIYAPIRVICSPKACVPIFIVMHIRSLCHSVLGTMIRMRSFREYEIPL